MDITDVGIKYRIDIRIKYRDNRYHKYRYKI